MRAGTKILFAVAALLVMAMARPAAAQGVYGAFALSSSTGAYGFAYNFNTQEEARQRALAECVKRTSSGDCKVSANIVRNCIAVARGNNNVFGWAIGWPVDERPERALNECAGANGADCKVVAQFCSGTQ